jgi:hypothetical protein
MWPWDQEASIMLERATWVAGLVWFVIKELYKGD